jgi:HlyD family secretion protein
MAVAYFRVEDGKRIREGLPMRVAPASVERERHGSILGAVLTVSTYPVTTEAAATQIGDLDTARYLIGGESRVEVQARLEPDPHSPSGFAWTSGKGPADVAITPGTTAEVRVTIEERAPITLLLPFLRSLASG